MGKPASIVNTVNLPVLPDRRRTRNVIAAPLPGAVVRPVLDRAELRARRFRRLRDILRAGLACVAVAAVGAAPPDSAYPLILTASYAVFATVLATGHGGSGGEKLALVADTVFLPTLLLPSAEASGHVTLLIAATGSWVFLSGFCGSVYRTRLHGLFYVGFAAGAALLHSATAADVLLAAATSFVAVFVARIVQHRRVSPAIELSERIQRALASAPAGSPREATTSSS